MSRVTSKLKIWAARIGVAIFIVVDVGAAALIIADITLQATGKAVDFSNIYIFYGGPVIVSCLNMAFNKRKS